MLSPYQQEQIRKIKELRNPPPGVMEALLAHIQSLKGDQGEKGDTPVKGVDYFTADEIRKITAFIQSQVRVPSDGAQGLPGLNGKDGKNGAAGYTPIKGQDYWTPSDKKEIITELARLIPKAETIDMEGVLDKATASAKKGIPTPKEIVGEILRDPKLRLLMHGAGSSTSSGGGALGNWYPITGTIDGINKVFTIGATPASGTAPMITLGRQVQIPATDYTLSGTTLTYVTAPDALLSGEPHKAYIMV